MTLIVGLAILLIGPLALIHVVGSRLPREHRSSRSVRVHATPSEVFRAITDVESFPSWRSGLKKVETLTPVEGRKHYRESSRQGALTFEVTEALANSRLVTTIIDEGQPFGGRWTFDLKPEGVDTEVTITEDGFVNPPIFRLLSRYAFGHTATIDAYLKDLERRFSQARA